MMHECGLRSPVSGLALALALALTNNPRDLFFCSST